ncbi:MAG: response regulator [Pirellulales bacterium]
MLDLMLPKRDGWQVLQELRRQRPTPVLILTARDTVRDRVLGLDGGADDYLVSSFDLQELLARLRAIIRRAAGQARSSIRIGDVEIDTARGWSRREVVRAAHGRGIRAGRTASAPSRQACQPFDDLRSSV